MFGSKKITYKDMTVEAGMTGVDITCRDYKFVHMTFEELAELLYPIVDKLEKTREGWGKSSLPEAQT